MLDRVSSVFGFVPVVGKCFYCRTVVDAQVGGGWGIVGRGQVGERFLDCVEFCIVNFRFMAQVA